MSSMHESNLNAVDLNLLKTLGALLETSSVTGAGRVLHLTQPAVSRALGRLRLLFDDQLLVRAGRTMVLTPLAESLRPAVRDILGQVTELIEPRRFDPALDRVRFRLNAPEGLSMLLLTSVIDRLVEEAPSVDFVFSHETTARFASMEEGAIDLAIDVVADLPMGFSQQQLFADRLVCVARVGHPVMRTPLTPERFISWPQVKLLAPGREAFEQKMIADGLRCRNLVEIANFVSAAAFVARTDALLVLPSHLAIAVMHTFELTRFELPMEVSNNPVAQIWHRRVDSDPAQCWLRSRLAALLTDDTIVTQML